MRLVLTFALASFGLTTPALAAAPTPCENAALMKSLGNLRLGQASKVTRADDHVQIDLVQGKSTETALRVSCDAIEVPVAEAVETPREREPARTRVVAGVTVSRSAGGAISLEFPARVLDLEPVQVLVMFDDSVSVVRGDKVFYALARRADGTVVETEGIGNGCGCERVRHPDGRQEERPLRR